MLHIELNTESYHFLSSCHFFINVSLSQCLYINNCHFPGFYTKKSIQKTLSKKGLLLHSSLHGSYVVSISAAQLKDSE